MAGERKDMDTSADDTGSSVVLHSRASALAQRMPRLQLEPLRADEDDAEARDTCLRFVLHDASLAMANALRRVMLADVPTMAFHLVAIDDNTSVLIDHFLAHRIGQIPLVSTDVMSFPPSGACTCSSHCDRCAVVFALDVQNHTLQHLEVTSDDFKHVPFVESKRMNTVKPSDNKLPNGQRQPPTVLVKLGPGQRVKLQAIAMRGTGAQHAKWNPCCDASFSTEPDIRMRKDMMRNWTHAAKQKLVDCCPTQVFGIGKTGDIEIENPLQCIFCNTCVATAADLSTANVHSTDDLIRVHEKSSPFHFYVEGTGAMRPAQIVELAIEFLCDKLTNIQKLIC